MTIDVHAHCVPDGLAPALARQSFGVDVPPMDPLLLDVPARLEAMDRMGVDLQVVSPFIDLTCYWLPDAAGRRYSRLFNELMASTVAQAPDRFHALGTVPLQSGKAAADELVHAVTKLGMVGVEIGTDTGSGQLDDDDLEPFWEAAAGLGCLMLLHPAAGARDRLPYLLAYLVDNPADTTRAVARLMFGGVLDRHPGLKVCLVHGGGFLPYQVGRLQRGFTVYGTQHGARLTSAPLDLLHRLYYDTVLNSVDAIRLLIDLVGVERVLLGTDYPFALGDLDPLATLAAVPGLDDGDRKLIEHGNAQRVLNGSAR